MHGWASKREKREESERTAGQTRSVQVRRTEGALVENDMSHVKPVRVQAVLTGIKEIASAPRLRPHRAVSITSLFLLLFLVAILPQTKALLPRQLRPYCSYRFNFNPSTCAIARVAPPGQMTESLSKALITSRRLSDLNKSPEKEGTGVATPRTTQRIRRSRAEQTLVASKLSATPSDDTVFSKHPLQAIYDILAAVPDILTVASSPREAECIWDIMRLLPRITLADLKISPPVIARLPYGVCMSIAGQADRFDITAFLLPKGFTLPLHDHPHMMVCTKLLMGEARIRSFSRLHPTPPPTPSISDDDDYSGGNRSTGDMDVDYEARHNPETNRRKSLSDDERDIFDLRLDEVKTASGDPWLLTAEDCNFHEITPLTDCVMLDVLLPPYDEEKERNCNFYTSLQRADGYWSLQPMTPSQTESIKLPVNVAYRGITPNPTLR